MMTEIEKANLCEALQFVADGATLLRTTLLAGAKTGDSDLSNELQRTIFTTRVYIAACLDLCTLPEHGS